MIGIPNIKYIGNYQKEVQAEDCAFENIVMYKPSDFFIMSENRNKFIKACEKMCRSDEDYAGFIKYVTNIIGIDFCQVSSQIFSTDASIEMHHGPLFTLYDYASIILEEFIETGKKITTYRVTNQLIQEHYDLHVQVVMLAITNHEAVHNRDIFLNIKQGFGDVSGFIEKYQKYLNDNQKYRIWKYLDLCESTDSFDNNIFDVEKVKKIVKL